MSEAQAPRALQLFTDRDDQRAVIEQFLARVRAGNAHQHPGVLSFHGVGGVGKSTLRQKALADFCAGLKGDHYDIRPFAIAGLDLDTDSVNPAMPIPQILGRVRNSLRKADLSTPLFDYLYLVWWGEENPGQPIKLKRQAGNDGLTGGLLDVADLAANLASVFGVGLPSSGLAKSVHKLFPKIGDWFAGTRARARFDGSPSGWSQRERVENMPAMLALDLLDTLNRQPQTAICLVIDGFERVQSRASQPDAQWALAMLVGEVLRCDDRLPPPDGKPLRGRIGFLLFGRETLRWADLYRRERRRTDWPRQIEKHAELLGLSESDARDFLLDRAAPWERAQDRPDAGDLIERHAEAIMQAAAERLPDRLPSFLPYYLDLAVLLIRDHSGDFSAELLGETPGELERRFLRSLERPHFRALQALALTLEFDRPLFDFLIAQGFVAGQASTDFAWLVGEHWSFVNPVGDRPGFHAFHRHMQASLIASLAPAEETERAREIVLALLDRLAAKIAFARPVDFGLERQAAYGDAMDLLRAHAAAELLEAETAVGWALQLDALLDGAHATSLRQPALVWTLALAHDRLGADHPHTLTTRNNLAALTGDAGDPAAARDLFAALLPDRLRVLGADHPDTLRTRSNLAAWTGNAGDPAAARDLFGALLPDQQRVLGADHPDTLRTRSNLTALTGDAGDPGAARDLFAALLPDRLRVLGADHPDTLRTRSNLAAWTGNAGDPAAARDLFGALLPDQQRVLGADHPDTLRTRYNLAAWTGDAGEPAAARDLFAALLPDYQRVLGADHPDTLTTREWIAHLEGMASSRPASPSSTSVESAPPRRNAPCPCGSGKHYKHCHGKLG